MKFYLWYDQVKKRYVTGTAKQLPVALEEVLYTFDANQLSACKKIVGNLNSIR
ncbi:MAG: hypothetical protein HRT61_16915 [Ekhidna sp.]|nr:hypothetical protein [Ekhidna sp.]